MSGNKGKVKSKFFNQDLFDDANVNDVGSSTSGQVISWGVGKNNNSAPDINNLSVLDSTQMFNFVNTEVTNFEENNAYNNGMNNNIVNNNVMNNSNNGLFDGSQFAQSMGGQQTIGMPNQQTYTNDVNDVFAVSKFDSNVNNNVISNEFVQNTPTFTGYNADPVLVQPNNINNNEMPVYGSPMVFDNSNQAVQQQNSFIPEVPNVDNNTVAVPAFDPFNGGAEPVTPYVPENPMPVVNNDADLQMQQNSPLFAMAAESQIIEMPTGEKELKPLNVTANDGEINDDMRSNQPLSLMALSGESIDESQKAKDVVENSKYFQSTPLEDNRLKIEDIVPVAAPAVDVLAEPVRDINLKELTRSFVGNEYGKISMSPFSFCGGFFGNVYFFYRKMFIEGIILTVINFFIMFIMYKSYIIGMGLGLGEFIVLGLLTNPIYLSFAERQARSIANNNPKATQYELQKICQLKGGTNLFLGLIIGIILNLLCSTILNNVAGVPSFMELIDGEKIQLSPDKKASIDEVVTYNVPTEFERVKNSQVPYIIKETIKKRGKELLIESCGFNIYLVSGHDTSKELVTYMADTEQRYNKVGTYKSIAGEVWDTYEYDSGQFFYYYRAREYNGHIVLVTYVRHMFATEGMCELHFENIMNSIKEK